MGLHLGRRAGMLKGQSPPGDARTTLPPTNSRLPAVVSPRGGPHSLTTAFGTTITTLSLPAMRRRFAMKIVVIGGTGLIGSKTIPILRQGGHEVVAASPNTCVNTITGQGLKDAVAGPQLVIDLCSSPSFEDRAWLEFFETSRRNLLAAEGAAGVRHHVALSIVGTDRTPDNGYFRAKVAQEKLIEKSGIPYTIIRATQF